MSVKSNATHPMRLGCISRNLMIRELGGRREGSMLLQSEISARYQLQGQCQGFVDITPRAAPSLPFALAWNQNPNRGRLLLMGSEDGHVIVLDTNEGRIPTALMGGVSNARPRALWQAHQNAIFAGCWAKDDELLMTASGDRTIGIWDTATAQPLAFCSGHDASVKVLAPMPDCDQVFASGSRDGAIMLWDIRQPTKWNPKQLKQMLAPLWVRQSAHAPAPAIKALASRRRLGGKAPPATVTAAVFMSDSHMLATAGSKDGCVKLWDLRKVTSPVQEVLSLATSHDNHSEMLPASRSGACRVRRSRSALATPHHAPEAAHGLFQFTCQGTKGVPFGVTSLCTSPLGDQLLISCSNHCHYVYRTAALDRGPIASFDMGLPGTSDFYVKATFSPDGEHILSGSSDGNARIWQVCHPESPPLLLEGHTDIVTGVAWCAQEPLQVATCSDDATVRIWSLKHVPRKASALSAVMARSTLALLASRAGTSLPSVHGGGAALPDDVEELQLRRLPLQPQDPTPSTKALPVVLNAAHAAAAALLRPLQLPVTPDTSLASARAPELLLPPAAPLTSAGKVASLSSLLIASAPVVPEQTTPALLNSALGPPGPWQQCITPEQQQVAPGACVVDEGTEARYAQSTSNSDDNSFDDKENHAPTSAFQSWDFAPAAPESPPPPVMSLAPTFSLLDCQHDTAAPWWALGAAAQLTAPQALEITAVAATVPAAAQPSRPGPARPVLGELDVAANGSVSLPEHAAGGGLAALAGVAAFRTPPRPVRDAPACSSSSSTCERTTFRDHGSTAGSSARQKGLPPTRPHMPAMPLVAQTSRAAPLASPPLIAATTVLQHLENTGGTLDRSKHNRVGVSNASPKADAKPQAAGVCSRQPLGEIQAAGGRLGPTPHSERGTGQSSRKRQRTLGECWPEVGPCPQAASKLDQQQ